MENKPKKMSHLFLILSWIFSVFFLLVFFKNSGWLPNTPVTMYDLTYLIVFFIFFVLPFITRIKLGQLEVERKILEESESGEKPKTAGESKERPKTAMGLKILNTLWRRQVLKFPELNGSWTFRLNTVAPEFLEFREAGNRLMGEGLISETDTGQFLITIEGLRYCAKHYKDFPADMWFKDVPIPEGNLEKLLQHVKRLD